MRSEPVGQCGAALDAEQRRRLDALLSALAEVFAAEGRAGGDAAAAALRAAVGEPHRAAPAGDDDSPPRAALLETSAASAPGLDADRRLETLVAAARDAVDLLSWRHSGLRDGRIRADIARAMLTSYLLGPEGPIQAQHLRVGLFFQGAGLDYPIRTHAAEETFYILTGAASWRLGDAPPELRGPGAYVHHPSNAPHASRTGAQATLTAWRWTGDVRFESYKLSG